MEVEGSQVGWVFWLQWVLASTVGVVVGLFTGAVFTPYDVPRVPVLYGLLGIGLGIGVGVLQWLVLRRRVSGAGWWVLASAAAGYGTLQAGPMPFSTSLQSFGLLLSWTRVVALSGAVTGTLQWLVLRGQVSRAGWWVLASTVGWGLGVTVARAFPWGVDTSDAIGALVVTGAVLGAVTGEALVWLLRQPVPMTGWRRYVDKCLLLSWKKVLVIVGVWVLSVVLHKAIYGPFQDYFGINGGLVPNAVFTLGTVLIPVYFIISLVYTMIRKMKRDEYLLLSWKTLLIIPAWVLSAVLHNVIYGLFLECFNRAGHDEAVFFTIALFVIPLFFIISLVYTVIRKVVKLVRNRTS